MLLFKRPPEPLGFAKQVAKNRKVVRLYVHGLRSSGRLSYTDDTAPAPSGSSRSGKKRDVFVAKWGRFKDAFSKAQHGKCAYCEVSVIGGQAGDVEHYYPKAQVRALDDDPTTWGRERPYLSNVEGRSTKVLCEVGYWWLAYEWSNYLLACEVCNQYWKGAIFPVENDPRTLPPDEGVDEVALLLNPYEDVNPAEHVSYDKFGNIYPVEGSRRGFELIRTCGLHRPSLRGARESIATEVFEVTNNLFLVESPEQLTEILHTLYLKGVETSQYPGMVRIIIEQRVGLTWTEVVEQLASLLISELLDAAAAPDRRGLLMRLYEIGNETREDAELVHRIVMRSSGLRWEALVAELASSMAELLNTLADERISVSVRSYLYEMGSHGPAALGIVRAAIHQRGGLSWESLEAHVRLSRGWQYRAKTA